MKIPIYLIFLLLLISSCSTKKKVNAPTVGKPAWFKMPARFYDASHDERETVHPFFDLNPFWEFELSTVNFFLLNKIGDKITYKLDLVSGHTYQDKILCERNDLWKRDYSFGNEFKFTYGIIPRTLNSINLPLEVVVLGDQEKFYSSKELIAGQKIKIIGGLLFQECSRRDCIKSQKWQQREILIGVNLFDDQFRLINSLKDLKKTNVIKKLSIELENIFGGFVSNTETFPTSRVLKNISKKVILNKVQNNNKIFNLDEISSLKKNCLYLYDYFWNKISKYKNSKMNFTQMFGTLHSKLNTKLKTCFQYVKSSEINQNEHRHWFFEYLKNLVNLSRIGVNFSCSTNYWDYNGRLQKTNFKTCSHERLDQAFRYSINVNNLLANKQRPHYRYITYDNGVYGTHQKIYSWVRDNGKKMNCVQKQHIKKSIFPQNIKSFNFSK